MLRRLILIILGTGTKEHCARRLYWTGDPEGTTSFIRVEAGELYRLGPDAPRHEKFQGRPIEIPPWLLTYLRAWRKHDVAAKRERVLYGKDGKELAVMSTALKRIGNRAGLSNVTPGLLADTFAVLSMMMDGPLYGIAMTMGSSPKTVLAKYKHFRRDFHKRATEALQRPAALKKL